MPVWSVPVHPGVHANPTPGFLLRTSAARETEWPPRLSDGCARFKLCQAASAALRVSDESALPARLPGHPDGTDRRAAAMPAGMSDGRPDRPIVHPSVQSRSLLGTERWMGTVVLGHSRRHPQPSCPAMPTAQVDGQPPAPSRPESR